MLYSMSLRRHSRSRRSCESWSEEAQSKFKRGDAAMSDAPRSLVAMAGDAARQNQDRVSELAAPEMEVFSPENDSRVGVDRAVAPDGVVLDGPSSVVAVAADAAAVDGVRVTKAARLEN